MAADTTGEQRNGGQSAALGQAPCPSGAWVVAEGWREALEAGGWRGLDDVFGLANDGRLSKTGLPTWRERLCATLRHSVRGAVTVYVKRFRGAPWPEQARRGWRADPNHGTAWTEWCWLWQLREAGITVPEPIAYGEEMVGPWERRSAVVMAAVAGDALERWCQSHDTPLSPALRRALAELTARLHAQGLAHRDWYLAHVFADGADTEQPRLSLIDLQRVMRMGWRRTRWVVKDLAALHYSTPATAAGAVERLRWLKQYLTLRRAYAAGETPEAPWGRTERLLVRRIAARAEQMRRHDRRRGVVSTGR